MKFTYFYNEFEVPDVRSNVKYIRLADVLTDANQKPVIDEILNGIKGIKHSGGEWDMSFNKSYVNITSKRARCGDLYNEDDYIDITLTQFETVLDSWRGFISKNIKNKMEIEIK